MKKINILPPKIFNLLAAGEVVENPSSVVKECVENSIDADATAITISITNGGFDEISISDNGHGIHESEVEKVFLPHATSKIEKASDLEQIGTLGFRGEAMSSIASVSKINVITKTNNDSIATQLSLVAGEVVSKSKVSANNGTTINIKNLFYNTPARKKFLSSPTVERNKVTNIVQKLMLGNPHISWKYIVDGEIIYTTREQGTLDKIVELIYGRETVDNIIPVSSGNPLLGINGYISIPSFSKRNRTYQTVMINSRTVEGGTIADAVNAAFSTNMTVGNFPFFVLNLLIDESVVDVNVHPRKLQVKFERENEIFDFVKGVIGDALDKYFYEKNKSLVKHEDKEQITIEQQAFTASHDKKVLKTIKFFSAASSTDEEVRDLLNLGKVLDEKYHAEEKERPEKKSIKQQKILIDEGPVVQILGTVFDCYILLSHGDKLVIIDQHAAHERMLYDDLKSQIDSGSIATQTLVEPLLLYPNPIELNQISELIPSFEKFGFEISIFGNNCVRITEVPIIIASEESIGTFIDSMLGEVRGKKIRTLSAIIDEKIIAICCKNAIKAGRSLTHDQIKYFLDQFKNKKQVATCPHGRPVIISYTKKDMEKLFARK
ncbi:MAG: DNA mismatch repair endonuclease MutL [Firmicutes bacterium]|nr:DNA mismatch repair endonuclease MutL [Bacillota bacterium]